MRAARQFLAYPSNWLAVGILLALALVALGAERIITREETFSPFPSTRPEPPDAEHWLGTSADGRDVFRPLIWGTRDAFRFGLMVTGITALAGVVLGAVAGYAGGVVNTVLMRITDGFLAFPAIASIWLFTQVLWPPSFQIDDYSSVQRLLLEWRVGPAMLALIAFSWMPYARLTNTNVIRLKQADFVEAARAQGASHLRILLRHLLPNAIGPAIVLAARDVGGMVVLAMAFSFIGLPGDGSAWGALLVGNRNFIYGSGGNPLRYWWTFVPVTTMIVLFGVGWNLLGDGFNRLLDPRQKRAVLRSRGGRVRARGVHGD
jgi:peptide/nickel transport system permease protein